MPASSSSAFSSAKPTLSTATVPDVASVYAVFSALTALLKLRFAGDAGGKLLLFGQLDAEGAAVAMAGNIAGAATLGVDADGERLKQGIRHGFCDFLVNNLDEALRILKNEIRKQQPVSVCLQGDLGATLKEMLARGVQPDVMALVGHGSASATFAERGAIPLQNRVATESSRVSWTAASAPALWLPKVDALAASVIPRADERLRWLKLAPRYLGRSMGGGRYLEMTGNEMAQFERLVAEAVGSGEIGVSILIDTDPSRERAYFHSSAR